MTRVFLLALPQGHHSLLCYLRLHYLLLPPSRLCVVLLRILISYSVAALTPASYPLPSFVGSQGQHPLLCHLWLRYLLWPPSKLCIVQSQYAS